MVETEPMVLECPDCERTREFSYSGYFTMAGGKEAHVRSCGECGFKRHFTPEGIPFGKIRKRKGRQSVPKNKKLNRKVGQTGPKITPRKGSGLNSSDTSPKITPPKGLEGFLSRTSTLSTYEKGRQFERFCQTLLEAMGYEVEHTGQSGDRGVDLKAVRQLPIGRQTLVIQCKHQESVSAEVVIQILGMVNAANVNQGLVITTGSFTADAKKFAEENHTIEIIDGPRLAELVGQYID